MRNVSISACDLGRAGDDMSRVGENGLIDENAFSIEKLSYRICLADCDSNNCSLRLQ